MVAGSLAIVALLISAANAALLGPDFTNLPQIELVAVVQTDIPALPELKELQSLGVVDQMQQGLTSLGGKIKLLATGLTPSSESCYNAPPTPLACSDSFSSSFGAFVKLIETQSPGSVATKLPGLQAALLAATDKTNVGFSDPAKSPNINRIILLATHDESEFLTSGVSKMKGDGTDTCASGPPDAAVLAKILKERDVILVVLAIGDGVAPAYKTYGSALSGEDRNLYHVIASEDFRGLSPEEQKAAAEKMAQQADVQALMKYLKARFESQGAAFPNFMPTQPPQEHTGATTSVRGIHVVCVMAVAASFAVLF